MRMIYRRMPKLRITVAGKTFEHDLTGSAVTAGRNEDLDLTLPTREASREHLRVGKLRDGGWGVLDLGSTHGTFLNREKLEPKRPSRLAHDDEIRIGKAVRIVFLDPPAKEEEKSDGIVLRSRADRRREQRSAAAGRRRRERKAAADAQAPDSPEPVEPEPEVIEVGPEPVEPEEPPEDVLEIEDEAMLDRLMQDKPAFDRLLAGDRKVVFGKYHMKKRLSEGGMGVVFRAHHRGQRFDVALKLLHSRMVDAKNIARFKQEAWAISAFDHPNVVKVRDMASHAGMHYIAMDFIDGDDLLHIGFRRELTFWQVMEVIDRLADVLRLVHGRNIWHRDIKPQNVLMAKDGTIKLIDFGIASIEREHDAATETGEGLIMGTPAFLSPEQGARGKMGPIDGRADLYSLGAVMYYLLTGRRPFTGKSAIEILTNNLKNPPLHPHSIDEMIPEGLVEICLKLLEKAPDDRYQTARDLQAALAKWRKSPDGRNEAERHKKIVKLRARKAKKK